jgi:hypothetical protein
LNELKNQVPTRHENMYIFNDLFLPTSPVTEVLGAENVFSVYPPNESSFVGSSGWFHNHFADADSASLIFSAGDLNILADQIVRDSATFQLNYKKFMIGCVADSNANYILMVDDLAKFKTWAMNPLRSNELLVELQFNAMGLNQAQLPLSKAETEKRFLKVIKDAGLKLFRGNANFTVWTPIKLNASETNVVEIGCP